MAWDTVSDAYRKAEQKQKFIMYGAILATILIAMKMDKKRGR